MTALPACSNGGVLAPQMLSVVCLIRRENAQFCFPQDPRVGIQGDLLRDNRDRDFEEEVHEV
jgi:hypothetical protein